MDAPTTNKIPIFYKAYLFLLFMAKILIVDDAPELDDWVDFFNEEGHEAYRAASGESGLERLAADKPHVVLLDHDMDGMSGYDFAVKVRSDSQYNDLPLVGIGSFAINEREYLNEMMGKPFTIEAALDCIRRHT